MRKPLPQRLLECPDLQAALECALDEFRELTGAARGNLQLVNRQTGDLSIEAQHGFQPGFLKFFERVTPGDGTACGRALRRQCPVIVKDVMADPSFAPYRDVAVHAGFRAVASIPIVSPKQLSLGVVSVHFASPDQLGNLRLERLLPIAGLTADAILGRLSARSAIDTGLRAGNLLGDSKAAIDRSLQRIARSRDLIRLSRNVAGRHRS